MLTFSFDGREGERSRRNRIRYGACQRLRVVRQLMLVVGATAAALMHDDHSRRVHTVTASPMADEFAFSACGLRRRLSRSRLHASARCLTERDGHLAAPFRGFEAAPCCQNPVTESRTTVMMSRTRVVRSGSSEASVCMASIFDDDHNECAGGTVAFMILPA